MFYSREVRTREKKKGRWKLEHHTIDKEAQDDTNGDKK